MYLERQDFLYTHTYVYTLCTHLGCSFGPGTLVPHSVWLCDDDGLFHGVNCGFWEKRLLFFKNSVPGHSSLNFPHLNGVLIWLTLLSYFFWHFWHKSSNFIDCTTKYLYKVLIIHLAIRILTQIIIYYLLILICVNGNCNKERCA